MATAPYDNADYVLDLARALINDSALSKSGNLLADSQPYTFVFLNSAWRTLQDELMNSGVENFPNEIVLSNLPVVGSTDPASQAFISFSTFFDGNANQVAPLLPQDLVVPLKLWERPSGTNQVFAEMAPANDGLSSRTKTTNLGQWEWRGDSIYLIGATQNVDVRLRYSRYLADITPQGSSPIPILRSAKALAYFVASEFATARGSPVADSFAQKGMNEVKQMVERTTRKQQRGQHRRRGYSRRGGSRGWGWF